MNEIYKRFGFNNYFSNKKNQEKLVKYIKENGKIIKGIEKDYINAWEDIDNSIGLQFTVLKGSENDFDKIVPHVTNDAIWNLRILDHIEDDLYLCENAESNSGEYAINIINKDVLPSCSRYDTFTTQVCGFAITPVKIFSEKCADKSLLANDVVNANVTALFKAHFTEDSKVKEERINMLCGVVYDFSKCESSLFEGTTYYRALFYTKLGRFRLYFEENLIEDDENLMELLLKGGKLDDYIYIECACSIQADAYLNESDSVYVPNYENNLSLCRRAFSEEEFDFLYDYMREDCTYKSNNWQFDDRDGIIGTFKRISKEKCNVDMKKILLLSTDNESKKKYEGKEILLYTQEGKDAQIPFYVETDENGKIYNIEMDTNSYTWWGTSYPLAVYNRNLSYLEKVEKLSHEEALEKINCLEFNKDFDLYFDKLCNEVLDNIKNRKLTKNRNKNYVYFTTVKISKNTKEKEYNINYIRSNNFGISDFLFFNFLDMFFKPNLVDNILNIKYSKNRTGIRYGSMNGECYYSMSELKKIYKSIKEVDKLLSKEIDDETLQNDLLYYMISSFTYYEDLTYKYLSLKGQVDLFNCCREEIRGFYKDFIKKMTILINVANKNECDYISMIFTY